MCQLIRKTLLVLIIVACSEVLAQQEKYKTVAIMVGEQSPDGCELLGKVKGSSKDDQTSEANEGSTPYVDRLIKARNNLRNEAQKLGGKNVHFNNHPGFERYPIRFNPITLYIITGVTPSSVHQSG